MEFFSYDSFLQYSTTVRPSDDTKKKIPFSRLSNQATSNTSRAPFAPNEQVINAIKMYTDNVALFYNPRPECMEQTNTDSLKNASNPSSDKLHHNRFSAKSLS